MRAEVDDAGLLFARRTGRAPAARFVRSVVVAMRCCFESGFARARTGSVCVFSSSELVERFVRGRESETLTEAAAERRT